MRHVLAIDQSTSASKALLFDENGQRIDRVSRDHRQNYPQPGWVEHDAEEIWQNVLQVTAELLNRNPDRVRDIACVSITNQRETIAVFERGSGKPLHPAIVWQCRRSDAICEEHKAAGRDVLVHGRTGLRIDAYFSGSKLQWLIRNRPDLADRLEKGQALIGTIDAYLVYRLTGGAVFATDSTNASRTLLFDIGRLSWDPELCDLWQVPMDALPEVRDSSARFGETTLGGAIEDPIPIVGVMGDSQAALFAQRCFEPGTAKVTLGTGSSVLLNVGSEPRFSSSGVVTALAWVVAGTPVYAFEGIIIHSAATLKWLQDQLGLVKDVGEIEVLAGQVEDSGGVYLVPAFSGLGLPYWAPEARAMITGLTGFSDRRHLARAALESIAYQLREALEAMQSESGVALRALKVDGGPTANRLLMQFTADITQRELQVVNVSDCSPLGAALAGLLGIGVHDSLASISRLPRDERIYAPSMPVSAVDSNLAGWRRAVHQVLAGINPHPDSEAEP